MGKPFQNPHLRLTKIFKHLHRFVNDKDEWFVILLAFKIRFLVVQHSYLRGLWNNWYLWIWAALIGRFLPVSAVITVLNKALFYALGKIRGKSYRFVLKIVPWFIPEWDTFIWMSFLCYISSKYPERDSYLLT